PRARRGCAAAHRTDRDQAACGGVDGSWASKRLRAIGRTSVGQPDRRRTRGLRAGCPEEQKKRPGGQGRELRGGGWKQDRERPRIPADPPEGGRWITGGVASTVCID